MSASWPYSSLRMSSHTLVWDQEYILRVQRSTAATMCMYMHGQYCYSMYVHPWSILLQYTCMVNTATMCTYMHGQYCYSMYVHPWSILLQYVRIYMHSQCCYNIFVHAWSILLQYVCTGMVHIQDYQGVSHRFPTHYTCSLH